MPGPGGMWVGGDGTFRVRSDGNLSVTKTANECTECGACLPCCCAGAYGCGACITPQYVDVTISGWTSPTFCTFGEGTYRMVYVSGTINGTHRLSQGAGGSCGNGYTHVGWILQETSTLDVIYTFEEITGYTLTPVTPPAGYPIIQYVLDMYGNLTVYLLTNFIPGSTYSNVTLLGGNSTAATGSTGKFACVDTLVSDPTTIQSGNNYGQCGNSGSYTVAPYLDGNTCNICNQCPTGKQDAIYCSSQKKFTLTTDVTGYSQTFTLYGPNNGGGSIVGYSTSGGSQKAVIDCVEVSGVPHWRITISENSGYGGGCTIVATTPCPTFETHWDCIAPGSYTWTITLTSCTSGTVAGTSIGAITNAGTGTPSEIIKPSSEIIKPSGIAKPCNCGGEPKKLQSLDALRKKLQKLH